MNISQLKRCKYLEEHPDELHLFTRLATNDRTLELLRRLADISEVGDGPIVMYVLASIALNASWLPKKIVFECARSDDGTDITVKLRTEHACIPHWTPMICAFPLEECLYAAMTIERAFPLFFRMQTETTGNDCLSGVILSYKAGTERKDPESFRGLERGLLDSIVNLGREPLSSRSRDTRASELVFSGPPEGRAADTIPADSGIPDEFESSERIASGKRP